MGDKTAYKGTQQRRIAAHQCITCGDRLSDASKRLNCSACAAERAHREMQMRASRRKVQFCISCGAPRLRGRSKCAPCLARDAQYQVDMRARWTSAGLCAGCGQRPPLATLRENTEHRVCEACYFHNAARARLGSRTHWQALRARLIAQDFTCPYTGTRLVLGVNDSVDHIYPISRFPKLRDDPANIEWVRRDVNGMKGDRTPGEFLALIHRILEYRS
jgi:5-methylcytosine-specific restriction endonuclease McrA